MVLTFSGGHENVRVGKRAVPYPILMLSSLHLQFTKLLPVRELIVE